MKLEANGKTVNAAVFAKLSTAQLMRGPKEWIVRNGATFALVRPVDAAKLLPCGWSIV